MSHDHNTSQNNRLYTQSVTIHFYLVVIVTAFCHVTLKRPKIGYFGNLLYSVSSKQLTDQPEILTTYSSNPCQKP